MQYTVNLTSKGQMTLPKEARDKIGVKPNEKVLIELKGDKVTVKKAPKLQDIWKLTATSKRWPGDREADRLMGIAKKVEYGKVKTYRS